MILAVPDCWRTTVPSEQVQELPPLPRAPVAVKSAPTTVPVIVENPKNSLKSGLAIFIELPERSIVVGTFENAVPVSSADRKLTRQPLSPVMEASSTLKLQRCPRMEKAEEEQRTELEPRVCCRHRRWWQTSVRPLEAMRRAS